MARLARALGAAALCVLPVLVTAARGPTRAPAPVADCAVPQATPGTEEPAPATPLRVALALGSGSMHGFAHIGVIEALEAHGLDVRIVTGTSAGALVGGLWASGIPAFRIERLIAECDCDHVGDVSGSWQGLLKNDRLAERLGTAFGGRPIESWPRRFAAVATELDSGHRRLLMSGDGALALQASTAVPMLYRPVVIDGERLADGALVEPVPVRAARDLGADYVIAVDVAYRPYEEAASGLAGNALQAMHILVNTLAAEQLSGADFVIRLDVHRDLMDCGRDAVVAAGRGVVGRVWPDLRRSLAAARKR